MELDELNRRITELEKKITRLEGEAFLSERLNERTLKTVEALLAHLEALLKLSGGWENGNGSADLPAKG